MTKSEWTQTGRWCHPLAWFYSIAIRECNHTPPSCRRRWTPKMNDSSHLPPSGFRVRASSATQRIVGLCADPLAGCSSMASGFSRQRLSAMGSEKLLKTCCASWVHHPVISSIQTPCHRKVDPHENGVGIRATIYLGTTIKCVQCVQRCFNVASLG